MTAPKMLLLTHTGRVLTSERGHPSLIDIAVGLSRQPRFGGQANRWWSVLDHSLFCDELVQRMSAYPCVRGASDDEEAKRRCRLALLLHDAHEALTGDVPTPLKTPDFKRVQEELDGRIFRAFYPTGYAGYRDAETQLVVKDIDARALRAEAHAFSRDDASDIFGMADPSDCEILQKLLKEDNYVFAIPPERFFGQDEHPAVREYLRRMLELL